jgi:hypothetical protein
MLLSLGDVIDVAVYATDGEIGKVSNFLFDDRSWKIQYLVVDVGNWLSRRDVIIDVSAMEQPDWENRILRTRLTRDQVRHSPDVDSKKPVSRQQEIALRKYYGWPDLHGSSFPSIPLPAGREFPVQGEEDPHLRCSENVTGYGVWAGKHEIGRLENFIVDEDSWHLGYLDVRTGGWLHGRSMLVPTRWVKSLSWADHRVYLDHALASKAD